MKKIILLIVGILFFGYSHAQTTNNAYGNNMILVEPNVWAIYSGDINQDGVLDIFDQIELDNSTFNNDFGYLTTDLTGDGVVDIFDQIILDNNTFNLVFAQTP